MGSYRRDSDPPTGPSALGRIPIKQVPAGQVPAGQPSAAYGTGSGSLPGGPPGAGAGAAARGRSPSGREAGSDLRARLVPYLDLFERLTDEELSRLCGTPTSVVAAMRVQVDEVRRAFLPYADLFDRLSDDELRRLSGASSKAVAFYRRVRTRSAEAADSSPLVPAAARSGRPAVAARSGAVRAGPPALEDDDLDFGVFLEEDSEGEAAITREYGLDEGF